MGDEGNGGGKRIHLVAICGVGMAPLAVMLKEAGYRVTGSDQAAFAPMSDVLAAADIDILPGFDDAHLSAAGNRPDLVVVGNAVPRTNVEAVAAERMGIERMSFPQAVARFFLEGRRSLVVAGTHGKTTTTGMLASALQLAGLEPGYLVGGLVRDLGRFASAGTGEFFVIEGDEYDSAFFDKRPKFVHYRPAAAIVTSVEFDHADIYGSLDEVKAAFGGLAGRLGADGPLIAYGDDPNVLDAVGSAGAGRIVTYGLQRHCRWRPAGIEAGPAGTRFDLTYDGRREARLALRLTGTMNVLNATAVYALCAALDVDRSAVADALAAYRGPARRQELIGEAGGVAIIDDFAHHPTAVAATLAAMAERFPGRRLCAVFEPRSNTSRRALFQRRYADALQAADTVVVSEVYAKENDPLTADERLSTERLVGDLRSFGVDAWAADGPEAILDRLVTELVPGDVVVCMSNGAFGNLPRRLLASIGSGSLAGAVV